MCCCVSLVFDVFSFHICGNGNLLNPLGFHNWYPLLSFHIWKTWCCAFGFSFVLCSFGTHCLNTNHQNTQRYEMFGCLPLHCSYGVDPINVLVAMLFNAWTILLITSTLRNFCRCFTCNMLHVASMIIFLSCLMKPFCSWA